MRNRGKKFALNKAEGKVLGVCAGIADYTGVDATIIRIGVVLATLIGGFPWTLIAYVVAGVIAKPARSGRYSLADHRDQGDRMRSLDLRLQAIETYATSSNSQLAREIEELR